MFMYVHVCPHTLLSSKRTVASCAGNAACCPSGRRPPKIAPSISRGAPPPERSGRALTKKLLGIGSFRCSIIVGEACQRL